MNEPINTEVPHASKASKIINKVIAIALILIALGLCVFLKWELADTTVLQVNNAPFPARIIPDTSNGSNGILVLTLDYCKKQPVNGQLRISYVSASREVFLPLTPEKGSVGCNPTKDIPILIPNDLPTDTYQLKFKAVYSLNPLKNNVTETFLSQPVKITNSRTSTTDTTNSLSSVGATGPSDNN